MEWLGAALFTVFVKGAGFSSSLQPFNREVLITFAVFTL
jgi:hypothetical protein